MGVVNWSLLHDFESLHYCLQGQSQLFFLFLGDRNEKMELCLYVSVYDPMSYFGKFIEKYFRNFFDPFVSVFLGQFVHSKIVRSGM